MWVYCPGHLRVRDEKTADSRAKNTDIQGKAMPEKDAMVTGVLMTTLQQGDETEEGGRNWVSTPSMQQTLSYSASHGGSL